MPSDRGKVPAFAKVSTGPLIAVRENKRKATFRNRRREEILLVYVDGKMISEGERADFIVAHPRIVDAIVELKGSDVSKAIRQIRATHLAWLATGLAGVRHAALVVRGKGVRPQMMPAFERWQREFRKSLRMKLIIETHNREYDFEEFLLSGGSRG